MGTTNGVDRYSYRELFELWLGFKNQLEAIEMLSDFADITLGEAAELNEYFWDKFDGKLK